MLGDRFMRFDTAKSHLNWVSLALLLIISSETLAVKTGNKEEMRALGLQHKTAWALYEALRKQAGGGTRLSWDKVPDWSGMYTRNVDVSRGVRGIVFDLDQPAGGLPTAKLTPEYHQRLIKKLEDLNKDIEYDPLSACAPPGYPRWLTVPFLREHVVAPDLTLLIAEPFNSIRRVYTDGRGHMPEEDRYPLYYGDSIGFWNGDKLVVHTNQLMAGSYTRAQPDHSDQVETVEIWQKVDDRNIEVDVWVYDPPSLIEPWYVRQRYTKLTDPDKRLRMRYWYCQENPNNAVYETKEGSSDFTDFTFTRQDDAKGETK